MSFSNVIGWTQGMGELPAVIRLMNREDGPETIDDACRILGLPGENEWPDRGVNPITATVLDTEGRDLTKLYLIVFADDSTPQFPDGDPGVLALYCDSDGHPVPAMSENLTDSDRIGVFSWPGVKIVGRR